MSQGYDGTLSRKTTAHTYTLSAHRDIAVDTHAHALQQTPERQRRHGQSVPPPLKNPEYTSQGMHMQRQSAARDKA